MLNLDQVAAATHAIETAKRRLRRLGAPGDLDDAAQAAWIAIIESLPNFRDGVDANLAGYLYRVAVRQMGLALSRALAVVSIPKNHPELAREHSHRCPLDRASGVADDEDVEARLWALTRDQRVREIIDDLLSRMNLVEQDAVRRCLGLAGVEEAPAAVALALGVGRPLVYRAVETFRRHFRKDSRVLLLLTETAP